MAKYIIDKMFLNEPKLSFTYNLTFNIINRPKQSARQSNGRQQFFSANTSSILKSTTNSEPSMADDSIANTGLHSERPSTTTSRRRKNQSGDNNGRQQFFTANTSPFHESTKNPEAPMTDDSIANADLHSDRPSTTTSGPRVNQSGDNPMPDKSNVNIGMHSDIPTSQKQNQKRNNKKKPTKNARHTRRPTNIPSSSHTANPSADVPNNSSPHENPKGTRSSKSSSSSSSREMPPQSDGNNSDDGEPNPTQSANVSNGLSAVNNDTPEIIFTRISQKAGELFLEFLNKSNSNVWSREPSAVKEEVVFEWGQNSRTNLRKVNLKNDMWAYIEYTDSFGKVPQKMKYKVQAEEDLKGLLELVHVNKFSELAKNL
ncbi:putative protein TPRXL isoform X2 [Contarinia nasturtii]|uniref:putative protein TPRXL isoform X2 n=1 Tax=Contarinia nasturtii TaxID=265458 RepID=UPI0012D3B8FF|nr:putative protein TPRXL isoform X2 [Contarinia nasturtii]